jgi:type VI secretion system VasD/TssJ family lipoprotein
MTGQSRGYKARPGLGRLLPAGLLLGLLLGLASGCSSSSGSGSDSGSQAPIQATSPERVIWNFAASALTLNLKAAADLNYDDSQAHTLRLCIYQLADVSDFLQLAANPEGMSKLLTGESFGPSVKAAYSQIVAPGQVMSLVYDRMEGAKYVALAAGYYNLAGHSTCHWQIPVNSREEGIFFKTVYYFPGELKMAIMLEASSLQDMGGDS